MGVAALTMAFQQRMANLPAPLMGGRPPVTFASGVPLRIQVFLALGADLTAASSTWAWTDITSYVRYNPGISVGSGRTDESQTVQPGTGGLVLDNRDGRFSRTNPMGAHFGLLTRNTPILVLVDPGSGDYRFLEQYINEWPVRWPDKSGNDTTVAVTTGGILRRLGQGQRLLRSALVRAITANATADSLRAYWPMEDGSGSAYAASALSGGTAMTVGGTGYSFAGASDPPGGSQDLVSLTDSSAVFVGTVPNLDSLTDAWRVECVFRLGAAFSTNLFYVTVASNSDVTHWTLTVDTSSSTTVTLTYHATDGTSVGYTATPTLTIGAWHHLVFVAASVGAPLQVTVTLDGTDVISQAPTLVASRPTSVVVQATGASSSNTVDIGHVAVYSWTLLGAALPTITDTYQAYLGYVGETAGARISRLCGEENVEVFVPDQAYTAAMGAQGVATLLDLLRECEAADGGVLYEKGFGLGYQSRWMRYNLAPTLNLDFAGGSVAEAPQPTDDDQQLRNVWEVTRTNGSSAVYIGDISEGVYATSLTVNVQSDTQLPAIAEWLTHLGSFNDLRWSQLDVNFTSPAGAALIQAWTDLLYGARVRALNAPTTVTYDPVDVFLEGRAEVVNPRWWAASFTTSPALPWEVTQVVGDGNRGRVDAGGSTLNAGIGTSDTSLSVASTGVLWVTLAAYPMDFPFDINIGGEQMTVIDLSGGSSPQTFTVTRSVNGVVKLHSAGDAVTLWRAGVIGR